MRAIPGPRAYSLEWKSLRRFDRDRERHQVVFGATRAAAIMGVSPYKKPLDVYCECMGLVEDEPDSAAMRRGRALEGFLLDEYEIEKGAYLTRDHPMYLHADHWFMGATPDALVVVDETLMPVGGVDAKTTTYRMFDREGVDPYKFGLEGTDQVPVDYVMQAQQQCAVLDLPWVDFPVCPEPRTIKFYRVERNADLIADLIQAEQEMAERLINQDPPEPHWEHPNARKLISALHGFSKGKSIEATPEMLQLWATAQDHKERIKTLESAVQIGTNKVLFLMGDAERATFPKGEKELRRIKVKASKYTVERAAHVQLRECKAKE